MSKLKYGQFPSLSEDNDNTLEKKVKLFDHTDELLLIVEEILIHEEWVKKLNQYMSSSSSMQSRLELLEAQDNRLSFHGFLSVLM